MAITYRFAENKIDRMPALVAELVRGPVTVIAVTEAVVGALAAKAGTTTIPVVFLSARIR